MATGDLSPQAQGVDPGAGDGVDRDAMLARLAAQEAELVQLRSEVAALRAAQAEASSLSLFDGLPAAGREGDGSDPRILSLILGATALVSGLVAVLTLLNGRILSPFGILVVAVTAALTWAASRTRVVPVEVSVVRGIVYIVQGETTHRFDLRKDSTGVEVVGHPQDPGWCVRFHRRHLDPFVVDRTMVDPEEFLAQAREYRPGL